MIIINIIQSNVSRHYYPPRRYGHVQVYTNLNFPKKKKKPNYYHTYLLDGFSATACRQDVSASRCTFRRGDFIPFIETFEIESVRDRSSTRERVEVHCFFPSTS